MNFHPKKKHAYTRFRTARALARTVTIYTQGCRWLYATKCANNMSTRTKLAQERKNIEGKYKYIESLTLAHSRTILEWDCQTKNEWAC